MRSAKSQMVKSGSLRMSSWVSTSSIFTASSFFSSGVRRLPAYFSLFEAGVVRLRYRTTHSTPNPKAISSKATTVFAFGPWCWVRASVLMLSSWA